MALRQKEKKFSKIFVLVFMGFTLIGMTFSFVFFGFSGSNTVRYNDFKFRLDQRNNIWLTEVNDRLASFSFLPQDVQQIPVSGLLNSLKGKIEIDTTYSLNDTNAQAIALAQHQMGLTMQNFNVFIRPGSLSENQFNLPVINCSDATSFIPVIYFKTENITEIKQDENCIIAQAGNPGDFLRLKDRIMYSVLDIME